MATFTDDPTLWMVLRSISDGLEILPDGLDMLVGVLCCVLGSFMLSYAAI